MLSTKKTHRVCTKSEKGYLTKRGAIKNFERSRILWNMLPTDFLLIKGKIPHIKWLTIVDIHPWTWRSHRTSGCTCTVCPRGLHPCYVVSYYIFRTSFYTVVKYINYAHTVQRDLYTMCTGSSDPFHIASLLYKWVTTSWTYCIYWTAS